MSQDKNIIPTAGQPRTGHYAITCDPALQVLATLDRFRVRAVVDWIDVKIVTASPTNFQTVQDRFRMILELKRRPWVQAIDPGPGGAACTFQTRIHNPPNYRWLIGVVDRLSNRLPLARAPERGLMEIAVDFYSKRQHRAELEAMTLRLKHTWSARGEKELECGPITQPLDQVSRLRPDTTLVIQDSHVLRRVYLKDRDDGEPLDVAQHRARAEVAPPLTVVANGDTSMEALRGFRFEAMSRWFAFRRVREQAAARGLNATASTAAELAAQCRMQLALRRGSRELQVQSRRLRRKHHPDTQADSEMKSRIRDALRDLSRRFNAVKPAK